MGSTLFYLATTLLSLPHICYFSYWNLQLIYRSSSWILFLFFFLILFLTRPSFPALQSFSSVFCRLLLIRTTPRSCQRQHQGLHFYSQFWNLAIKMPIDKSPASGSPLCPSQQDVCGSSINAAISMAFYGNTSPTLLSLKYCPVVLELSEKWLKYWWEGWG